MKKTISIFALAAVGFVLFLGGCRKTKALESIELKHGDTRFVNLCQDNTTIEMGEHQGKLFFICVFPSTSDYDNTLAVFENSQIRVIEHFPRVQDTLVARPTGEQKNGVLPIALSNGFFLYWSCTSIHESRTLVCLDVDTAQKRELITVSSKAARDAFFSPDGTYYVPDETSPTTLYFPISHGEIGAAVEASNHFTIGNREYAVEGVDNDLVYYEDEDRKLVSLDFAEKRKIIPTEYGLLIHNNEGDGSQLYLVTESGEVIDLFSVPCVWASSALSFYGDYAYISVERYESFGDFGMIPYRNDKVHGTYKISLKDYSVEQINDQVFAGLYIFDDSGIFGCDDNLNLYRIGFNGQSIDLVCSLD